VGELAAGLPVSRPAVSQHLKVLKEARLVRDEARGTRRLYRLDPMGAAELRAYYERFWAAALGAFRTHVEHSQAREDG
jgi:DNA-binding transcriptional ArsR family regulator